MLAVTPRTAGTLLIWKIMTLGKLCSSFSWVPVRNSQIIVKRRQLNKHSGKYCGCYSINALWIFFNFDFLDMSFLKLFMLFVFIFYYFFVSILHFVLSKFFLKKQADNETTPTWILQAKWCMICICEVPWATQKTKLRYVSVSDSRHVNIFRVDLSPLH